MFSDQWGIGEPISESTLDRMLSQLPQREGKITNLVSTGRYWEAYSELNTTISFFNTAVQQQPSRLPGVVQRLLGWIQKIQGAIATIAQGVGGNGYSIGVSAPWGVSVSISFSA